MSGVRIGSERAGRQISIYEGDVVNGGALRRMVREVIEHNRAGGWAGCDGWHLSHRQR